ncbi:MAG: GAF domain-containing protein [Myxococcota bacterium]
MSVRAAAHRNALVALARFLAQDRTGGTMGPALEMLTKVLRAKGGLAYMVERDHLVVVAERGLPRDARSELNRLPLDDHWFVAQRVAHRRKVEVQAPLRQGFAPRLATSLQEAGWGAIAATPIQVGRQLRGVFAIGAASATAFDQETQMLLEAVGAVLALAVERELTLQRVKERHLDDGKTTQLATLGMVASTAAHDIEAPLGALAAQLQRQLLRIRKLRDMLNEADVPAAIPAAFDALEVAAEDSAAVVQSAQRVSSRLLTLGRESEMETVDLTRVVADATDLLASLFETREVKLELDDADRPPRFVEGRVEALQMMLAQLLMYLAEVAVDTIEIAPLVRIRYEDAVERHVLVVESTGLSDVPSSPAPDSLMTHATAAGRKALDLAQRTVRTHQGHLEVGASALEGPLLRIVLPVSDAEPLVLDRASMLPPSPWVSEPGDPTPTLLWVDADVAFTRAVTRDVATHDCFVAGCVDEALAMLDALDPPPEIILCDVHLPDGLGTLVHAQAPRELKDRFIFVTEAMLSAEVGQYIQASGRPTLMKPVGHDGLRALLSDQQGAESLRLSLTLHSSPPTEEGDAPDIAVAEVSSLEEEEVLEEVDMQRPTLIEPEQMRAARRALDRRRAPTPFVRPRVSDDRDD